MQHPIQVRLYFYAVTVIEEAEREWYAVAEVAGECLSTRGETKKQALSRWQNGANELWHLRQGRN